MINRWPDETEFANLVRELAAQTPTPPPQSIADRLAPTGEGVFARLARGAIQAIGQGVADLPRVLQKLSDVTTEMAQREGIRVNKTDVLKRFAEAIEPRDLSNEATLAEKIGRVIGGLAVAIPKYAPAVKAGPLMIPAFGATGALTAWGRDLPPRDIAKEAAIEATFGGLLKGAHALPRWPGAAAMAVGAPAVEAAATGGEAPVEDLVLSGLTLGTLRALGRRLPTKLEKDIRALGYPENVYKKMTLKEIRNVVRERKRYEPPVAPPSPPPEPPPEPTTATREPYVFGLGDEAVQERVSELRTAHEVSRQQYVINKTLEQKGYTQEQIAAMPPHLREALARSAETAETIIVNPKDGTAYRAAPTPPKTEVPPITPEAARTPAPEPINIDALLTKVDIDSATAAELKAFTAELKKAMAETAEKPPKAPKAPKAATTAQKQKAEPKAPPAQQPKPAHKEEIPAEDVTLTPQEQRILQTAKELGIPPDLAAGLAVFPQTPAEITPTKTGRRARPADVTPKTAGILKEFEKLKLPTAEDDAAYREWFLRKKAEESAAKAKPAATPTAPPPTTAGGLRIPASTTEAIRLGQSWKKEGVAGYEKTVAFWREYLRGDHDPFNKQMLRETIEGYLGFTGTKSATREQIVAGLTKLREAFYKSKDKKPKVKFSKLEEEVRDMLVGKKGVGERPFIDDLQRLGFDKNDPRLQRLDETNARLIIDAAAGPEDVSISPTGRVTLIKKHTVVPQAQPTPEPPIPPVIERQVAPITEAAVKPTAADTVAATLAKTEPEAIAQARTTAKVEVPTDALLEKAVEWSGIPRERVSEWIRTAPDSAKELTLRNYLEFLEKNAAEAAKTGEAMNKAELDAVRKLNEIKVKDPDLNESLAVLEDIARRTSDKARTAKELLDDGRLSQADYDLIELERINALKAVEAKRASLIREAVKTHDKTGKAEKIAIITEGDVSGILTRTKLNATTDEFAFIVQPPGSGTSKPAVRATVKVEVTPDLATVLGSTGLDTLPVKLRKAITSKIQAHYNSDGKPLRTKPAEAGTNVKLRMGLDADTIADMTKRAKQRMVSIYQHFAERRGASKSIPAEERADVYKLMKDAEAVRIKDEDLQAMRSAVHIPPSTQPLPKYDVPHVDITSIFGIPAAAKNPDIRFVSMEAGRNEIRVAALADKLVFGSDSKLNKIFEKIKAHPEREQLMDRLGRDMENYTRAAEGKYSFSQHPLLVEARENIVKLMSEIADTHDLRARGFFRERYYPLIADLPKTYEKIRAQFNSINSREELPPWFKITDKTTGTTVDYLISDEAFKTVKYITATKKEWKDLTYDQKNIIQYEVLRFEGLPYDWIYAPPEVQARIPKKEFNKHLEPRTGHALLEYKRDPEKVLMSYLLSMIRHESNQQFLDTVAPILNKYPSQPGNPLTVRAWLERIVRQSLHRKTPADAFISNAINHINNRIGTAVLSPNFHNDLSSRVVAQTVRGLFGPDTALRNLTDTLRTITYLRKLPTLEQLWTAAKVTLGKPDPDPHRQIMFGLLFGRESYALHGEQIGLRRPTTLAERLAYAESKAGKALAFYDWVADMALSPFRATEHFNRFLAFQMALEDAGRRGLSFREGVRLGLSKMLDHGPDLIIPDAYWKAFETVLRTQGAYSPVMRNPLMRGPLARISTLFWSYPANVIQFMTRGLIDSARSGDMWGLLSYSLYTGFQLSIAAVAAQLGLDVASFFGVGLLPIKFFSLPWDLLKNAYVSVWGKTYADRERGSIDFYNEVLTLGIPQYRYGKKVLETMRNLEDGFKRAGKKELMMMEMTPMIAIMDLIGYPYIGKRAIYEAVEEMSDKREEYTIKKREVVLKAIDAMKDGNLAKVRDILEKARKEDIILPYSDLIEYYKLHMQKTYLQSQLDKVPKHLRPQFERQIRELEERFLPATIMPTRRSMWSAPRQANMED